MRFLNYIVWPILIALALILSFLVYAAQTPWLSVKLMGNHGQPGQLSSVHWLKNNRLLVEEIIDYDSPSLNGASFPMQLKKLSLINLHGGTIQKFGLPVNTRIIGVSENQIWTFDKKEGLIGLSLKGDIKTPFSAILDKNPGLRNQFVNHSDFFFFNEEQKQLIIKSNTGVYYELNRENSLILRHNQQTPADFKQEHLLSENQLISRKGNLILALKGDNRKTLGIENGTKNPIFINGKFLYDSRTGQALQHQNNRYFILHQQNLTDPGFLITQVSARGEINWKFKSASILNRKNETGKLVWASQYQNQILLLIESNSCVRFVILDAQKGTIVQQSIL